MTQKLHDIISDERAVSPVIGVILMVAITVILAAVIGTFVLDLGQSAGQTAPQASLSVTTDNANQQFEISHTGGDSMADQETRVLISNESSAGESYTIDTGATDELFGVGDTLIIGFNKSGASNVYVDSSSDVWTGRDNATTTVPPGHNIATGVQYTITVIDTESQRQIFQTTVTA